MAPIAAAPPHTHTTPQEILNQLGIIIRVHSSTQTNLIC